MEPDPYESPRAKSERQKAEQRLAFAVLMELVDTGDLDKPTAFAIVGELKPTVIGQYPASVYQSSQIAKLERSIDSAQASHD